MTSQKGILNKGDVMLSISKNRGKTMINIIGFA
jgi:hypothetical protein